MLNGNEVESIALELLDDWRNGNRRDFKDKVSKLQPIEALYCGLVILDYMQSDELERALFISTVYQD